MIPSLPAQHARALEWVLEIAIAALLPAVSEPMIVGVKLIAQDTKVRLSILLGAKPS